MTGREKREEEQRHDERCERQGVRGDLGSEPALVAGSGERRQDDHPDPVRGEQDDDEDRVRRKEAVRDGRAAEVPRDDDPDHPGKAGLDGHRDASDGSAAERAEVARVCTLAHRRDSVRAMANDTPLIDSAIADLRSEFGDIYAGRTVLVTGADGFMGSHLTEALVALGANVHAFVRATSSGALNNIGHLRNQLKVHFADLTDKTSIDYLMRELKESAGQAVGLPPRRSGARGRVVAPAVRDGDGKHDRDAQLAAVDRRHGLEIEKFDTAGTSEEYGNVRDDVPHHHDFDDAGSLILHERSPINPKSIYATAKVAADFLTMNYHDAFGVPGVVTRMFNNYGPRQNPRYVTGTIITQALDARDDRARQPRAAPRLLLLHRRSSWAPDSRCARDAG